MDPNTQGSGAPDGASGTTTPGGSSTPPAASGNPDGQPASLSTPPNDPKEWVKIAETAREALKRAKAAEDRLAAAESRSSGNGAPATASLTADQRLDNVDARFLELEVRRALDARDGLQQGQKDMIVRLANAERPKDVAGFVDGLITNFSVLPATQGTTPATPPGPPVVSDLGASNRSPVTNPKDFRSYTGPQWAALTPEERAERIAASRTSTNPFAKPTKR